MQTLQTKDQHLRPRQIILDGAEAQKYAPKLSLNALLTDCQYVTTLLHHGVFRNNILTELQSQSYNKTRILIKIN